MPSRMTIRVLHAGGTFGSAGHPLAPMPGAAFAAAWERHLAPLSGVPHRFEALDPPIDSAAATPADWLRIVRGVLGIAGENETVTESVLLVHGTDTMAWSAAAVAFLTALWEDGRPVARLEMPVMFTGSQLPLLEADGTRLRAGTDAVPNATGALAALAATRQPGVGIFFNGRAMQGLRAIKRHSTDPDAFTEPDGPVPVPTLPGADPAALGAQLHRIAPYLGKRAVVVLHAAPNAPEMMGAQLDALAGIEGLGALVLLGYGAGNMPAEGVLAPRLTALTERGVTVAITSQLHAGPAQSGTYSSGSWLADCGVLPTGDRTLPAIGAKLHVLLALAAAEGHGAEGRGADWVARAFVEAALEEGAAA